MKRHIAVGALVALGTLAGGARAQRPIYSSPHYEITPTHVRQGRFRAEALGRDTIASNYPRAAREVHFKFALNGRDNEFPPGIEHTVNLRPHRGEVALPLYAFAVEPRPQLPRPEDAAEGDDGVARLTIRLDLRHVRDAITQRGWYLPPQGDTIRRLDRVTVIGDTDPLVWDIGQVRVGAPQDLTNPDGDGIYTTTLTFRTEYLRPLDADGRARWVRTRDLSAFPELHAPEPLLDALYRLSLEELTQLVREDGALSAGAKWPGVWTRDVALSSLLSLAIVVPDAVRISLLKKVDARGRIIQDTGTGGSWPVSTDRMTWALAAWEVYAVTGDRDWLRTAYEIIKRSAIADAHAALDATSGLYRGESSFLDWREQSYPRWMQPVDIFQSQALGTNAVHHGAYRVLHSMGLALGAPAAEVNEWQLRAAGIRMGLVRDFWMPALNRHAQFTYGRVSLAQSPRYEALGEALAVLTQAVTRERGAGAMASAPRMAFGTPTLWPFITGEPFYHNATIWPFVTAFDTWAAADVGAMDAVERGLASTTRGTALFLTNKENLVAETGHFEGTALNSDRQLWSVAGTLAMHYRVLFGMRFDAERLRFTPMVPEAYAGMRELRSVKYRGATLTIRLSGWGECATPTMTLDGVSVPQAEVPATLTGEHVVGLTLGENCRSTGVTGANSAPARFAPATPTLSVQGEGVTRVLTWTAVPGATRYVLHRDGRPTDTLPELTTTVRATPRLAEYQLEAIDSLRVGSFLSEPVRIVTGVGVQEIVPTGGSQRLERASAPVSLRLVIAESGRYAIDAWYSNGNGPINTEDKAAIRTLDVDGAKVGVLVMPQRGAGTWALRGYSNPIVVNLAAGTRVFTVRYDSLDENMNGVENTAILHQLRVTRLPDARPSVPAPRVTKVEPPNWWIGHSINPVRLLVRGEHLAGARVTCGTLRCDSVRVSERGTNLFVNVVVPPGTRADAYPITIETAAGRTSVNFAVHAPLVRTGRFQGIGADDVVYLIMPDRFANGDTTNDNPARSRGLHRRDDPRYYHGGDLEGVRQRLPYLKSLGVTTVWLMPIYDNVDSIAHREPRPWAPHGFTDYHGYGAVDLYAVEEHFGDMAAYQRLVEDAHAQGMKVMMDMVANHTGPEHVWAQDPPTPTWYSGTLAQHLPNNWKMEALTDPYGARAVQDSTLRGWFADILPDFNQDDPEVERYLIQNTLWWVGMTGLDAIRQDTWPYVPRSFWRPWMAAIKREYPTVTVVGEVLNEDAAVVAFFEGTKANFDGIRTGIDQVFDFPLQAAVRRTFMFGGSVRGLAQSLARDRLYDHPERLVTVTDNHDMPRLPWEATAGDEGLMLAYTFLLTTRGIPQIYYGNEIGLQGGGDPDNRRDFPGGWRDDPRNAFEASGRDAREQRIFTHVQALLALRRSRAELRTAATEHLLVDDQQYVYRRGATVVAINNARTPVTVQVPGLGVSTAAVLGGCGVPRRDGADFVIDLAAQSACVY